ncbi:MAG: restriction endonuclease subunit S [Oscillospiraceae bacterium]|nr:restriction endonuclease subunit S [Oscillospiraceae bacterium]
MMWEKTTIGKHCTVTSSKRFHLSDRSDSGIPFYCSKEIIQKVNGQEITDCDYIKVEAYEEVKKKFGVPECGDLLITTRGTYGIPYLYNAEDKFYFADGNLTWLKEFDDQLNAEFLYYWILSYEGQKKIDAIAKGTAQKAVPIALIKDIELSIPDVETQKKITNILKSYDDLIANNHKQIKLLEESAQRLYKEWFIDLRFPGHENVTIVNGVPEGWKQYYLSEIVGYEIGGGWGEESVTEKCDNPAYVIRGTDLYGITHGVISEVPYRFHATSNLKSRQLIDGDIIFEVSGGSKTEGVARTALIRNTILQFLREPIMCASFCKLVRAKEKIHSQLLFDTFQYMRAFGKTGEYDKKSASSIVNYRWKDFLAQETILIPTDKLLLKYNTLSENMYQLILSKSVEIEKAKEARDRLLPKLMSGEIEV